MVIYLSYYCYNNEEQNALEKIIIGKLLVKFKQFDEIKIRRLFFFLIGLK